MKIKYGVLFAGLAVATAPVFAVDIPRPDTEKLNQHRRNVRKDVNAREMADFMAREMGKGRAERSKEKNRNSPRVENPKNRDAKLRADEFSEFMHTMMSQMD